jgi:hypothetical protein
MQLTGMLHGSKLPQFVDFPAAEVLAKRKKRRCFSREARCERRGDARRSCRTQEKIRLCALPARAGRSPTRDAVFAAICATLACGDR